MYLISLGLYILSGASESIESIVFLLFLASTLTYTFTREGLPSKETQAYPEAFKYKTTRINLYTEGMIALLVSVSLLIALNSSVKLLNQTITILLLWPIIIVGSYYLNKIHQKRQWLYSIADYVNYKLNTKVDIKLLNWLINNVKNEDDFSRVSQHIKSTDSTLVRETYSEIVNFLQTSNQPISFEEIKAVEKAKKL